MTLYRPDLWLLQPLFICLVRIAATSQCYTHQKQLLKYAYRFSDLPLHLSVYLADTRHDWCWSQLHLFCITVKQTMKEPGVESSKALLSACHLPAWALQVRKTARAILCRSFYFKLKMLQDYYVMRHHEKYPSRRSDWHFHPASAQCSSYTHC